MLETDRQKRRLWAKRRRDEAGGVGKESGCRAVWERQRVDVSTSRTDSLPPRASPAKTSLGMAVQPVCAAIEKRNTAKLQSSRLRSRKNVNSRVDEIR